MTKRAGRPMSDKPTNTPQVLLNDSQARRLHTHRQRGGATMAEILMAGVAARAAADSNEWHDRLMMATCKRHESQRDLLTIDFFGGSVNMYKGESFAHRSSFDSCLVEDTEGIVYAGSRENCISITMHLNKILRTSEAEGMVNDE